MIAPVFLLAAPLVWGGQQRLEAGDAAEYDQLGYSVSFGADRALVGAYGESSYRGAAYVFVESGGAFVEEQKLVATDGAEDDHLGFAVSLGAERALAGAPGDDTGRGSAFVFRRSDDTWSEEQKLVATDGAEGDQLGWSVSLHGDRALAGAYGSDAGRGAAYVFVRSENSWDEEQKLVASDANEGDLFGYSVALGGGRLLVGAPASDAALGAAYVFVRDGGSWSEEQKLVASDLAGADHFGVAVSLAGDRALVGAYWDDERRGAAYVFIRNGGAWNEEQKLVAGDGAAGHRFGGAVSLGADRALIGAYARDAGRGAAYVFALSDDGWSEEALLVASDGTNNDLFGWSVALAEDRALVGAYYDDNLRGAAYVFSPGLGIGVSCSAGDECTSGVCEDDVCCDRECTPGERCRAELKTFGADGRCGPALAAELGAPCASGDACSSGHCADGVCCDAVCSGACEACTLALKGEGEDGSCGAVVRGDACAKAPRESDDDGDSGCACHASGPRAHTPGASSGGTSPLPAFLICLTLAVWVMRRKRLPRIKGLHCSQL